MASAWLERLRRLLPAAWFGALAAVAFLAAPAPFAVLASADAGRVNSRVFLHETWASIAIALLLWLLERWRARRSAAEGRGSLLSTEMVLLLGALLCTFVGSFALQPMIPAARLGQAPIGFAAVHTASVGVFGLKLLLVAALAWRAASAR